MLPKTFQTASKLSYNTKDLLNRQLERLVYVEPIFHRVSSTTDSKGQWQPLETLHTFPCAM
jgi:hypothetical protein